MSIWSAVSVVLFLAFLGISISRLLAMAGKQSTDSGEKSGNNKGASRWSPPSILDGVNVVVIAGVAFWLGSLPGKVDNLGTQLSQLRQDVTAVRQDIGTLTGEVFQNDDSLKIRAARTEEVLKAIRPRIIREDYDAEIARLNQELEQLRAEYRKLQEEMRGLIATLKK